MTITLMLQDVLSSKVDQAHLYKMVFETFKVIRVVCSSFLNIKLFMRFLLYSNSSVTHGNS